ESPDNDLGCPEVDEDGFTVRPDIARSEVENAGCSSSDSDYDEDEPRKFYVHIKPVQPREAAGSAEAAVEQLKATVGNLILAPGVGGTVRRQASRKWHRGGGSEAWGHHSIPELLSLGTSQHSRAPWGHRVLPQPHSLGISQHSRAPFLGDITEFPSSVPWGHHRIPELCSLGTSQNSQAPFLGDITEFPSSILWGHHIIPEPHSLGTMPPFLRATPWGHHRIPELHSLGTVPSSLRPNPWGHHILPEPPW
ncbi:uncharacterized protein LOC111944002, partial [Cyanistes caeruleus]|uniref:uncharacterized protein LOC111944002 n=1 Tax=Cyanistes caeruleus TaxID=156563 RepID=UPI000CDA4EC9